MLSLIAHKKRARGVRKVKCWKSGGDFQTSFERRRKRHFLRIHVAMRERDRISADCAVHVCVCNAYEEEKVIGVWVKAGCGKFILEEVPAGEYAPQRLEKWLVVRYFFNNPGYTCREDFSGVITRCKKLNRKIYIVKLYWL